MDIQAEKLKLMKLILETDNVSLLESKEKLFKSEIHEEDFWNTLNQSEKDDILKGMEEIKNGESVSYESIIKNL